MNGENVVTFYNLFKDVNKMMVRLYVVIMCIIYSNFSVAQSDKKDKAYTEIFTFFCLVAVDMPDFPAEQNRLTHAAEEYGQEMAQWIETHKSTYQHILNNWQRFDTFTTADLNRFSEQKAKQAKQILQLWHAALQYQEPYILSFFSDQTDVVDKGGVVIFERKAIYLLSKKDFQRILESFNK
jgi:hypothetical protein